MKYERVELNKSFGLLSLNIISYTIKELNNAEDVLVLVQDMEYPKAYFGTKNEPKYLNKAGSKYEVKKDILAARVRQ